jgi:hypothetical protein
MSDPCKRRHAGADGCVAGTVAAMQIGLGDNGNGSRCGGVPVRGLMNLPGSTASLAAWRRGSSTRLPYEYHLAVLLPHSY